MIRQPYPGLRPFDRDENAVFFGREDQVDQLLDRLDDTHFIAVVGASGSGKSSLVRAGLLPALASGFMAGAGAHWATVELRPGDRPFSRLAQSLVRDTPWGGALRTGEGAGQDPTQGDRIAVGLEQDLRRGKLALNWLLGVHPLPADTRLLILVDQFEELFRFQRRAAGEAAAFVALLLGAASHPKVYVVITMRSEFIGDCSTYPDLPEAINAGIFLTPRLSPEQIADAVQLPARLFGGEVAPDLVLGLLADARDQIDQLPLVQHALMRLWDLDSGDKRLTLSELEALGGLRQALDDHAEEAFAELSGDQRRIAEVLFRTLTEAGPADRDTRRPAPLGEVADLAGVSPGQVAAVVEIFRRPGRSFLVPPTGSDLDRDSVLDIAHEALIRQWQRLRDWTADESERAELYRRLAGAAQRWQEGTGALWIDPDLEYALQWRARTRPNPAWVSRYGGDYQVAMAFLDAGQGQRQRQREERTALRRQALTRARVIASVAFLGLAIVAAVAGWGWIERRHALASEQQRTRALFDSGLTHAALLARTEDYVGARGLLTETRVLDAQIPPSRWLARDLLSRYAEILGGEPETVYRGPGSPLSQASLSPDGRWVAACGERGTLVLFEAESGALVHRLEGLDPEQVRDCCFDPAGRWLASAGNDRRISLWSLPDGNRAPGLLRQWQAPDAVMSLAVSPDGQRLASGGDDGTITLWDPNTGARVRALPGHRGRIAEVTGLAFSPGGEALASASDDGTARLWDPLSGSETARFEGHKAEVKGVAFSADGRLLATGGSDNRVILWDIATGAAVRVFTGHRNRVYGVAFAARPGEAGTAPLLVTSGFDRSVRIWDQDSAVTLRLLQGHTAAVNGIEVRGSKLYTASSDGTVRRWSLALPHQRLLDVAGEPASVAVCPAGRCLALGLADGGLRVFGLPDLGSLGQVVGAHVEDVQRLGFTADGSRLASAGFDGRARIWHMGPAGALEPLLTLMGHGDAVHGLAFSPDDRTLATAGYDGRIGLFDVATGEGRLIASTQGQVLSVAFDQGGQVVYSADRDDRKVRVWDLARDPPTLLRELPASRDLLMWAEPDADGARIAALGRDYEVSILDARDGLVLQRLVGHENAVIKARFLPGGEQLATAGMDATVRLWDLPTRSEVFALRLPTNQAAPSPLWDFDLRCTATGCWLAVPLTSGKLALYDFGLPALPGPLGGATTSASP